MGFWGWVGAIAAGWFAVSLIVGALWALVGKRIFKEPSAPRIVRRDGEPVSDKELAAVYEIAKLDAKLRGRA